MKRRAKKTRRGPGFVPMLVLVVLIAVVAVELVKLSGELKRKRAAVLEYTLQKQELMWKNESMRSDLEKANDPAFLQQFAMDHYGYLPSGARQFIPVHGVGD